MSKTTNDKIYQLLFKLRTTHEVEHNDNKWTTEFVYSIDETKQEIAKLIKETLQECIGEEEPYAESVYPSRNYKGTEAEFDKIRLDNEAAKARSLLRQEALTKLEEMMK